MEGARHSRVRRALLLSVFVTTLTAIASCGGGAGAPLPNPGSSPSGGTTLSGQVQQDLGARAASAVDAGVSGAEVALLDPATGGIDASQRSDGAGHFTFTGLTAGDRLLRVSFAGRHDFDGDGNLDLIEVLLPVQVRAGDNSAVANFSAVDQDGDGQPDGVRLKLDLSGAGRAEHELREIQCKNDTTRGDEDGDGSLNDERPKPDVDNDGLPDDASGRDNSLHGGVIHGEISAIVDGSVTVNGIAFRTTADTRWRIHGVDGPARPASFTVGTEVLVRGLWNGQNWIALGVMRVGEHNADPGQPGGDDGNLPAVQRFGGEITGLSDLRLSLGENSFMLTARTLWFTENGDATPADFKVGDKVLVKAELNADGAWVALGVFRPGDGSVQPPPPGPGPYDGAFRGTIKALTTTSLTIAGMNDPATGVFQDDAHTFVINDRTQWYAADGSQARPASFVVGDEVMIKAMRTGDSSTANTPDGAWVALAVMHVGDVKPPPPPGGDGRDFMGAITALTDTSLTIASSNDSTGANGGSFKFIVNDRTQWILENGQLGRASDFAVGETVVVKAQLAPDGAWVAMGVMRSGGVQPPPPPQDEAFSGAITALSAASLTINSANDPAGVFGGSHTFMLSASTLWILGDGTLGSAADFAVGDFVTVKAKLDANGGWVAVGVMGTGSGGDPGDPDDPNNPMG